MSGEKQIWLIKIGIQLTAFTPYIIGIQPTDAEAKSRSKIYAMKAVPEMTVFCPATKEVGSAATAIKNITFE